MTDTHEFIGLIPAAGHARRLGYLNQSKEILPVRVEQYLNLDTPTKPACHHLLSRLAIAGVSKAFVITRIDKLDVPELLVRNPARDLHLSFIFMDKSPGVPWTLDHAFPFVRESNIVMGFPDIMIWPDTFYKDIVDALEVDRSDVVLGVMHSENAGEADVVEFSPDGGVEKIQPKPGGRLAARVWIGAAWRPSFTTFLHQFVQDNVLDDPEETELYLGDILAASLENLKVRAITFDDGHYIDIGTPEEYAKVAPASFELGNRGQKR